MGSPITSQDPKVQSANAVPAAMRTPGTNHFRTRSIQEARALKPGVLDGARHPLEETLFANFRDPHQERSGLVHRAADDLIAGGPLHRDGLPRHETVVHPGKALHDHAVHGDAFAGTDAHQGGAANVCGADGKCSCEHHSMGPHCNIITETVNVASST